MTHSMLHFTIAMRISTYFLTKLFAGAAGVFIGLLFSPGIGSIIRNNVSGKGHSNNEFISDNFNDLVDSVSYPFEYKDDTFRLSNKPYIHASDLKIRTN